jgi:HlyD family secretion protein
MAQRKANTARKLVGVTVLALLLLAGAWFWLKQSAPKVENPYETAEARFGPIQQTVMATGRVIPNFEVDIKAKASGTIVRLPYDVSDRVNRGDLLVQLDPLDESRNVAQTAAQSSALGARTRQTAADLATARRRLQTERDRAEATIASARAKANQSRIQRQRLEQLVQQEYISRAEFDSGVAADLQAQAELENALVRRDEIANEQKALVANVSAVQAASAEARASQYTLLNAKRRLSETRIVSPISGIVTSRTAQLGTIVASGISNVGGGTSLMAVADVSRLYVLASVDESDIGQVRVGQPVNITADAFPGQTFGGVVERIASKGINLNNVITFEVKIRLTQSQQPLKTEMTTNISILTAEKPRALLVPSDAVSVGADGSQVRVLVKHKDTWKPLTRKVRTGLINATHTEIVSGLKAGENVVLGMQPSRWRKQDGENSLLPTNRGVMRSMGGKR